MRRLLCKFFGHKPVHVLEGQWQGRQDLSVHWAPWYCTRCGLGGPLRKRIPYAALLKWYRALFFKASEGAITEGEFLELQLVRRELDLAELENLKE